MGHESLKNAMIQLGHTHPHLRDTMRPVLDSISLYDKILKRMGGRIPFMKKYYHANAENTDRWYGWIQEVKNTYFTDGSYDILGLTLKTVISETSGLYELYKKLRKNQEPPPIPTHDTSANYETYKTYIEGWEETSLKALTQIRYDISELLHGATLIPFYKSKQPYNDVLRDVVKVLSQTTPPNASDTLKEWISQLSLIVEKEHYPKGALEALAKIIDNLKTLDKVSEKASKKNRSAVSEIMEKIVSSLSAPVVQPNALYLTASVMAIEEVLNKF